MSKPVELSATAAPQHVDQAVVEDALVTDAGEYGIRALSDIRISRTNRTRFNEANMQALSASIKKKGVAQPILIRPVTPTDEEPQIFEIVAGERRYRASIMAGLKTIPSMLRTLSDLDAAEIQIIENIQREDPHEMEEAEGFQQLMMKHGYTAAQLAEKIDKSKAYIYARLKLCALTSELREKFLDGKIDASTALLIARIPVPSTQIKAYKAITEPHGAGSQPLSHRSAEQVIQSRFMLDLTRASFSPTDIKLVRDAGTCKACPKRAGNQPEVFTGVNPDLCTDPDCYAEKKAAHEAQRLTAAHKSGIAVLEGADAQKYMRDHDTVIASTMLHRFGNLAPSADRHAPVSSIGAGLLPQPDFYTLDEHSGLVARFHHETMRAVLEQAGVIESEGVRLARLADESSSPEHREAAIKEAEKAEAREVKMATNRAKIASEQSYRLALYRALRSKAKGGLNTAALRMLIEQLISEFRLPTILQEAFYPGIQGTPEFARHLATASSSELLAILMDIFLGEGVEVAAYWDKEDDDEQPVYDTVVAMAEAEGIIPIYVRVHTELSGLPLENIEVHHLADFVEFFPERVNELSAFIIAERPHLVGAMVTAAERHGYIYQDQNWVKPAPTNDVTEAPEGEAEAGIPPSDQQGGRTKLQLKAKPADALIEPSAGPVIKIKKHRAVESPETLAPAKAWPFPSKTSTIENA